MHSEVRKEIDFDLEVFHVTKSKSTQKRFIRLKTRLNRMSLKRGLRVVGRAQKPDCSNRMIRAMTDQSRYKTIHSQSHSRRYAVCHR